ncbi:hypothetical protein CAI21_22470, partial [Alkalilimnicola ehrlichii]
MNNKSDRTPLVLTATHSRRPVRLDGEPLARGGEGTIYRLAGEPPLVAKLYHRPNRERQDKLAAMLADPPRLPPFERRGRQYPQITWPIGTLESMDGAFLGYAMPQLDVDNTVPLEFLLSARGRRATGLPEDYRFRVKVAYQLAHLVAELHAHGH